MIDPFCKFSGPWQVDDRGSITPVVTLRDQFAMAALTGLLADSDHIPTSDYARTQGFNNCWEYAARDCYKIADAMLAERSRQNIDGDTKP